MSFTFAHPAAVLPLKKRWSDHFNLTALVLGSMAPDFEYFVKMRIESKIGHSFIGFAIFNLPLVIVLSLIFHFVIKNTLVLHLPKKVNSLIRCDENLFEKGIGLSWFIIFIYSAIIGMFSHTFWDSFTHEKGYFVLLIPILKTRILNIPIYKFLQHGSTLIGFCFIFKFLYDVRSKVNINWKMVSSRRKLFYWMSVLLGTIAIVIARLINEDQIFSIKYLGIFIVSSISGLFISLTLASVIFYKKN